MLRFYSHGRDILSLTGVLGKITIKEYTYTINQTLDIRYLSCTSCVLYFLMLLLHGNRLLTRKKKQELANQKCRPP